MTRTPPRTEAVPRREGVAYLRKAAEFEGTARSALRDHRPNSAGLEAIHAVISACDALTITRLELRCKGEDHRDVLQLLDQITEAKGTHLKRQVFQVLSAKNRVEYGDLGLTVEEAGRLVVQAERVVRWVGAEIRS